MKEEGSWPSLCCNEDMNLVITDARGLGGDMFWPPSHPRGTKSYADLLVNQTDGDQWCSDPDGVFGYPASHDPWSVWLDIYYGGLRIGAHSNIIFSNGLLDPWSAAGVYARGTDPTPDINGRRKQLTTKGARVQNITQDGSMIALVIEYGGHHTDLMYSDPRDPKCVKEARTIETEHIRKWINEWNSWGMQCRY
jgi:hypothetical protein